MSEYDNKRAPVQGYSAGIPWSVHLEAYDAYCKKWSPQPALIDLEGRNCRGGFGVEELDEFVPGWRDKVSAIQALTEEKERLQGYVSDWRDKCVGLTDENKKLLERLEVVSKILEMHLDTNGAVNPENWEEQVELDEAFELLDALSPRMPDQCGDHEWGHFVDGVDWESCRFCGKVRRADDKNKPCKGPVRVGLRSNSG